MSLIAQVYVSYASRKISEDELKDILTKARQNNIERNITGLLLYRGGFFMQALEGKKEDVDYIYGKIKLDARHSNMWILYRREIKSRTFADWSMGFHIIGDDTLRSLDGFSEFLETPLSIDFFVQNSSYATTLLENFRDKESAF